MSFNRLYFFNEAFLDYSLYSKLVISRRTIGGLRLLNKT